MLPSNCTGFAGLNSLLDLNLNRPFASIAPFVEALLAAKIRPFLATV